MQFVSARPYTAILPTYFQAHPPSSESSANDSHDRGYFMASGAAPHQVFCLPEWRAAHPSPEGGSNYVSGVRNCQKLSSGTAKIGSTRAFSLQAPVIWSRVVTEGSILLFGARV